MSVEIAMFSDFIESSLNRIACDFLGEAALWSRRGPPPAAHPRLALEPGDGLVQALGHNENGGRHPTPARRGLTPDRRRGLAA